MAGVWIRPRSDTVRADEPVRHLHLTKKMREVLKAADLEHGVINDVPMMTMHALESRGLISKEWRGAGARAHTQPRQLTGGRSFPWYRDIKLTAEGIRAARTVQGLPGNL